MSTLTHPFQHILLERIGEEGELAKIVECFDKVSTAYGMEISAEKTRLMTNNIIGINTEIKVNGQRSFRQSQASSTWAQL